MRNGAATTSPVVGSVIPFESDSDSQVEVASVGTHSDFDSGEGDPEDEAEVQVSSLAFGAAARAALVALDSVDLEDEISHQSLCDVVSSSEACFYRAFA